MITTGDYKYDLLDNSFQIGKARYQIHLQDNLNGKPNKVLFVDRGTGISERITSLFPIGLGAYSGDAESSFFERDDATGFNFLLRFFTRFDKYGSKETWISIFNISPIGKRKKNNLYYDTVFNG